MYLLHAVSLPNLVIFLSGSRIRVIWKHKLAALAQLEAWRDAYIRTRLCDFVSLRGAAGLTTPTRLYYDGVTLSQAKSFFQFAGRKGEV